MNTQVMFYMIENDETGAQNKAAWVHTCFQAAYFYRQNQAVYIYTGDQALAHEIDELLWSFDPDSFVPHNLQGEGSARGAAVEIGWQAPKNRRPVLINLTSEVPNFANRYAMIVDFVPADEELKQLARTRYRAYRQMGFNVDNQPAQAISTTEEETAK